MNATAVIAEDEPLLSEALKAELSAQWPELKVAGVAANGDEALQSLLSLRPDVAFLDVRMPGLSGIEVAHALVEDLPAGRQPPLLVFVTAYERFALDAFAHAAVDYVLKPVEPDRFATTVARLRGRLIERGGDRIEAVSAQLRELLALPDPALSGRSPPPLRLIRASIGDAVRLIRIDDVLYLQSQDKYVNVVTATGEALIREPLRDLLPRLDPQQFVRIHRGTVVNLDCVEQATRGDLGRLSLTLRGRPERLVVSRVYAHLFRPM